MHVDLLPVALLAAHYGRHHHELVLADEVAYTSLVLAVGGEHVEFQGRRESHEEKHEAQKRPHAEPGSPHCQWCCRGGLQESWRRC